MPRSIDQAEGLAAKKMGLSPVPVKHDRQVVIVLGPPAAGKPTIANEVARARRATILDSDEIRKSLPVYDGGRGAHSVHEESSGLANSVPQTLIDRGTNLILPKVGDDVATIVNAVTPFRKPGCQVEIVNMAVDRAIARRRMFARIVATGRLILPAYTDHVGSKPTATYRALKEKGNADGWAEIDNTAPSVSPGVSPIVSAVIRSEKPLSMMIRVENRDLQVSPQEKTEIRRIMATPPGD